MCIREPAKLLDIFFIETLSQFFKHNVTELLARFKAMDNIAPIVLWAIFKAP